MEIVDSNFWGELGRVKQAVDECDFFSIHCEVTGMGESPTGHPYANHHFFRNITDDSEYVHLTKYTSQYLVVQFGLCTFRWNWDERRFDCEPYTFYTFPHWQFQNDRSFMSQPAFLEYLASHQFDFNKLVYQGIPYLNRKDELRIRSNPPRAPSYPPIPTPAPASFNDVIEPVIARIQAWLREADSNAQYPAIQNSSLELYLENKPDFPYQYFEARLKQDFPRLKFELLRHGDGTDTMGNYVANKSLLKISKLHNADYDNLDDQLMCLVRSAVGFRAIIDKLIESKKMLVGRDLFIPFIHIWEKFIGEPFPPSLSHWKNQIRDFFPNLLDLRFLTLDDTIADANRYPHFPEHSRDIPTIRETIDTLNKPPFNEYHCRYTIPEMHLRHAGNEAYMIGIAFLKYATYFREQFHPLGLLLKYTHPLTSYMGHFCLPAEQEEHDSYEKMLEPIYTGIQYKKKKIAPAPKPRAPEPPRQTPTGRAIPTDEQRQQLRRIFQKVKLQPNLPAISTQYAYQHALISPIELIRQNPLIFYEDFEAAICSGLRSDELPTYISHWNTALHI